MSIRHLTPERTILPLLLILLILPSTDALTITTVEDAKSQIRYLIGSGLIAYATSDERVSYYDEEGYDRYIDNEGAYDASDFINHSVGEKNTDSLYYYNRSTGVIIGLHHGNASHTYSDISAYTVTDGQMIAVTPDYYLVGQYPALSTGNAPIAVHYRNGTRKGYINGTWQTMACTRTWRTSDRIDCANPIYDPDNESIYVPTYFEIAMYYANLMRIDPTTLTVSHGSLTSGINIGVMGDKGNDVCTMTTIGGHDLILCSPGGSGSCANPYEYVHNMSGYTTAKYHVYDPPYEVFSWWRQPGTDKVVYRNVNKLYVYEQTSSSLKPMDNTLIYAGDQMTNNNCDGTDTIGAQSYKMTGNTIYYDDSSSVTKKASTTDEYAFNTEEYTQPFLNSQVYKDYYNTPGLFLRYDGGVITDPYDTSTISYCANCKPAGYEKVTGLHLKKDLITEGAVQSLSVISKVDNPYNNTITIALECDDGDLTATKTELWTDDADTIIDRYGMTAPYATMTYSANPIEEYTSAVTETASDNAKGIIIRNQTTFGSVIGGLTSSETYIGHYNVLDDGASIVTKLTNRYGDDAVTINVTSVETDYKVRLNGVEVYAGDKYSTLTGLVTITLKMRPGSVNYELEGVVSGSGTLALAHDAPIQWISFTNERAPKYVIIGPWALLEGGTPAWDTDTPDEYEGNHSYYAHTCAYDDGDEHLITLKYSLDGGVTTHVTSSFTYQYVASLLYAETTGGSGGSTPSTVTSEEGVANTQALLCTATGICNDNGRLMFAIFVMIAVLVASMHAMNERFHQTAATQAVPFLLFVILFVFFAAMGFFPTWFTVTAAIGASAILALKLNFFTAFGERGGGGGP